MDLVRGRQGKNLDPMGDFERLQNEINNLFNFDYQGNRGLFDRPASPPVDVIEKAESLVIRCDMPGIRKEDLDLSLARNVLTIKGEKKPEEGNDDAKKYRNETWSGVFQRTIALPDSVDPNKVEADLHDGVLEIAIAKREEVKPRHINVKVS
ncbi:MAG: Hsp20/alpha crystallin family protein [Spirochaetaceae bacterium]|nr:Hsp20/alpha crystallin family protein [Spirochaetaceae bacterium]MCF7948947.1 Hsp20/alpha crystallin family protein [Spirochaetia bacterium]MCF7950954.1 Hsp20/alpha crystallin family protein [Spirochaetaceae bacterium]